MITAPTHQPTGLEKTLALAIADRALQLAASYDVEQRWSRIDTIDLVLLAHRGCPLDLEQFLHSSDQDFAHDIGGIRRHLNRITGQLEDGFTPRCAVSAKVLAEQALAESRVLAEGSPRRGFFATLQSLREQSQCPTCQKTTLVFNVGVAGFKPETVTVDGHCTCPGGPAHHLLSGAGSGAET